MTVNTFFRVLIFTSLYFSVLNLHCQTPKKVTLLFAGDIMGHDTQIESAKMMGDGTYDYSSCFTHVEPWISSADIAIGNLEVTLAGSPYKGYPAFSSPDELAVALKNCGFDILANANNHALDRRKAGLERTLSVLDSLGLIQTGVFRDGTDRARRYPLIVEKNGIRLALLNYTYGTNGISVSPPNLVNFIDTLIIKGDLAKAATAEPDFTIVLMHWGAEYERTENESQRQMAQYLFKHGADAIIGSHPHVVQPIREYGNGKLVVYSLGNMISNQRKRYTDGGIMVSVTLEKTDSTRISDYSYLPIWVHKPEIKSGHAFSLVPANSDSVKIEKISFTSTEKEEMNTFLNDTRENLAGTKETESSLPLSQSVKR